MKNVNNRKNNRKHIRTVPHVPARMTVLLAGALLPTLLCKAEERPAFASQSGDGSLYTLLPHYKSGDVTRYQFTVHRTSDRKRTSDLDTLDTKFRMIMQETTRKATAEGGAILEENIEQADGDFDEHEVELTAAMPHVTLTRDKQGATLVDTTGGIPLIQEPVTEIFQLLGRVQRSCLPPTPVRPGDAWKFTWQETGEHAANSDNKTAAGKDIPPDHKTVEKENGIKNNKENRSENKNRNEDKSYPNKDTSVGTTDGRTEGTSSLVGQEVVNGQPTLRIKLEFTSLLHVPDIRKNGAKIDVTSHFAGAANVDAATGKFVRIQGVSEDTLPQGEKAKTEISLVLAPAVKTKS